MDLHLEDQKFAREYPKYSLYYNTMLESFYITRLAKQCYRYDHHFPRNIRWRSVYTDHFLLTDQFSERSTIGRDIDDTYWVEDVYYNIARSIYHNTMTAGGEDDDTIKEYLAKNRRSRLKPFSLQWIVGAIEADTYQKFNYCLSKIREVSWDGDW